MTGARKFFKLAFIFLMAAFIAALGFACGCESSYDWVVGTVKKHYYYGLPEDYEYDGDVKKFVATYLDRYSAYYTKEEYQAQNSSNNGNKVGIGVSYSFVPEGVHPSGGSGVMVERVVGNSPLAVCGLKRGEFIKSGVDEDGTEVLFNTSEAFASYVDGKELGESFTFVTDKGRYKIEKRRYTASYCKMCTADTAYEIAYVNGEPELVEYGGAGLEELPAYAAYVRLDQFYGLAPVEMELLIKKFNEGGLTSLILDLRGNGGGYVSLMSNLAYLFAGGISNYNTVSMRAIYRDGTNEIYKVSNTVSHDVNGKKHNHKLQTTLPAGTEVKVLADSMTASASEALIGVMIDNGVIGFGDIYVSDFSEEYLRFSGMREKNCRTYGKGIMQTTFTRSSGEALKITTAKIYWPKGERSIHGTGITVAMGCKALSADWGVTYSDGQLLLAINNIYG